MFNEGTSIFVSLNFDTTDATMSDLYIILMVVNRHVSSIINC